MKNNVVIVFANFKGGVGKTTSTYNCAAFLAHTGIRVLAVDLDPSANLSAAFGIDIKSQYLHIGEVLKGECSLSDAVINIGENLDLLPSCESLQAAKLEIELTYPRKWEVLLPNLTKYTGADIILIDTPPEQNVLSMNGLAASDYLVIPTICQYLPTLGLTQIVASIALLKDRMINDHLKLVGILPTLYKKNKENEKHITDLKGVFGDTVFTAPIRENTVIARSAREHMPITNYKESNGYSDYKVFADELLRRIGCGVTRKPDTAAVV